MGGRTRFVSCVNSRRSSLDNTLCLWLSERSRTRSPASLVKPPRARFARTRALLRLCTKPSFPILYPANISGKRIRMQLDGNKLIKVSLDNPYEVSDKLETFSSVYVSLTGKHATFELPAQEE